MLTKPKPLTRSNHLTRAGSSGPAASPGRRPATTGGAGAGRRRRHDVEHLDRLPAALGHLHPEHDLGALGDRGEAEDAQHVAVQKDVAFAVPGHHKAVALRGVEPFHMTTDKHLRNFPTSPAR